MRMYIKVDIDVDYPILINIDDVYFIDKVAMSSPLIISIVYNYFSIQKMPHLKSSYSKLYYENQCGYTYTYIILLGI